MGYLFKVKAKDLEHFPFFWFMYTEEGMIAYTFPESNKCSRCLTFVAFLVPCVLLSAGYPEVV